MKRLGFWEANKDTSASNRGGTLEKQIGLLWRRPWRKASKNTSVEPNKGWKKLLDFQLDFSFPEGGLNFMWLLWRAKPRTTQREEAARRRCWRWGLFATWHRDTRGCYGWWGHFLTPSQTSTKQLHSVPSMLSLNTISWEKHQRLMLLWQHCTEYFI